MRGNARILVSGGTGLVGGRLLPALLRQGYAVACLTRDAARAARALPGGVRAITWDGRTPPRDALAGAAAVIHLAGEPIFGGPLTARRRARIRDSRVESTRALLGALGRLPEAERPRAFVSASAVGYYGSRGEEILDERSPPGRGFLADVCRAWEGAAHGASEHGVRACSLRIGIALAREGGALPLMSLPFRLGLGGRLGDGRQWVPWIHLDDLVALFLRALRDENARGPVNAVAPEPVRNRELTRALARVLKKPALLRVPAFALRAAFGELAGELLGSRRVAPRRAQALGMLFAHDSIDSALGTELTR